MLADLKIILREITDLEKILRRRSLNTSEDRASIKKLQEIKKRVQALIVQEL